MPDTEPTRDTDDIQHAGVILENLDDRAAAAPGDYWCRRIDTGVWAVYRSRDENEIVDYLNPEGFYSAAQILLYLDRIEAENTENTDAIRDPGVH